MNKLDEIKNAVMKNAKKGKLTPTKYVGTYNYKSGYDTYFALSLNKDGDVIVYSCYKNDRGEVIDTYPTLLSELDEKALNEVYEHLNTKDEEITSLFDWYDEWEDSLYTNNTNILIHLGIIKPKKEKNEEYILDENAIPTLENENDAYYIDRNHKVGVLKYIGDIPTIIGNGGYTIDDETHKTIPIILKIYSVDGTKELITTYAWRYNKPNVCCHIGKRLLNSGCFKVVDSEKYSYYGYIFVPNKEQLIELFYKTNKKDTVTELYVVNPTEVCCFKSTYTEEDLLEDERCKKSKIIICHSKEEALEKFEEVRKNCLQKLDEYAKQAEEYFKTLKELCKGHNKLKDYEVPIGSLKVGDKFVGNITHRDKVFEITEIDTYGAVHLGKEGVLRPTTRVLPYDKIEATLNELRYDKIRRKISSLESRLQYLKETKNSLKKYVPLVDSGVQAYMDSFEKDVKEEFAYEEVGA